MDEELQPVFEAVARHREKFGMYPEFDGLFPKISLIDHYVYEIDKAIRMNKPLSMIEKRPSEFNKSDVFID